MENEIQKVEEKIEEVVEKAVEEVKEAFQSEESDLASDAKILTEDEAKAQGIDTEKVAAEAVSVEEAEAESGAHSDVCVCDECLSYTPEAPVEAEPVVEAQVEAPVKEVSETPAE